VKLVTRESAQCVNNNSESKSQGRLLKFPKKLKFFREIRDVKNILSFCQCQNVFREEAFADQS